jgi:hypothetical protein
LCRFYANSSGLRHFDRRPPMNTTAVENQIESKPKTDGEASCSKKKRSNNSTFQNGDYQHPLDNSIERNGDLKVQDEGDWKFWISYNQMTF